MDIFAAILWSDKEKNWEMKSTIRRENDHIQVLYVFIGNKHSYFLGDIQYLLPNKYSSSPSIPVLLFIG